MPPAASPVPPDPKRWQRGRLSDIETPQYQVYLPDKAKATGAAVVILPGGGYGILAADHEGHDYAKWLTERGIAGIVVKYRVSGNPELGYQFPVPFLDARRAIRTVRAKAAEWGDRSAKSRRDGLLRRRPPCQPLHHPLRRLLSRGGQG